jgi:hypothetical protein
MVVGATGLAGHFKELRSDAVLRERRPWTRSVEMAGWAEHSVFGMGFARVHRIEDLVGAVLQISSGFGV